MPVRLDPPALPGWEPAFATVQEQSRQRGHRALVVGGYVRDRLLGGERAAAIREVDILVEGQGATQLATAVGSALHLHPPVIFERFGTAHLDIDARHALEFVSSRVERYDRASRKPDVSPGTLKDDVMRRDFTINTLLMDWDGTVLDLTGRGLDDLKARRIVTPLEPQTTFDEGVIMNLDACRLRAGLASWTVAAALCGCGGGYDSDNFTGPNLANPAVYNLLGSVDAIDTAMRLGANHPMGPLELADFIGLDTCLSVMQVLYEGLADSKYRPCPLLVKYVEAGWLGRKAGRGFYDYRGEKPVPTR